ncbi:glycosyltransferase family 2 protein [Cyclobacterium roseum]|uniref:glycosyltransferase family 2 protein n=1 Tax=Cyclobacterium roseum TaxID=2666137 RepID=UPI0013911798|nr:glycosyltransferase family 2 protein [Cyclobacterium roseum]
MYKIAVLMTCHNRKEKTLLCLENLFNQKGLNSNIGCHVYLVDDGSIDGTAIAVKKKFSEITTLKGDGNLYWNRGMHKAWSEASKKNYDFYLWLNDDSFLYDFALTELVVSSESFDHKSIICGTFESAKEKGTFSYGGRYFLNNKYYPNVPNGELSTCDLINGNCVLIPDFVFQKVGNLDLTFRHAVGDIDYGLRAKKEGIVLYCTKVYVGTCEKNIKLPKWQISQTPLKERIRNLYSPLGYSPPMEYFIFEKRHFGYHIAIKHFISIHIRLLFPNWWK